MSILVTDAAFGVGEWPRPDLPMRPVPCGFACPCAPCARAELMAFCCAQTRDVTVLRRRDYAQVCRMPAAPGTNLMCFSPCCRYLYQLGSDADCVHVRAVATGELLFAAPVGVFPRHMRLHPDGSRLLVAGGAMDEAYVLTAPGLNRLAGIGTRYACFAADFWRGGLVLVCATDGEDIQTVVYTLPPQALKPRELTRLPGQPGGLCVCPDALHALVSTREGLMLLDLIGGRLLWNLPQWALSVRLECRGALALVSGALTGQVGLLDVRTPWNGRVLASGVEPQACFLPGGG